VALLGEAGCQVFGMHGSGTGNGLLAARALAEACDGQADPGAEEVTWAYQAAFHRGPGAVCAAYDVLRRMLASMSPAEVERLMVSGLLNVGLVLAGLDQRLPGPAQMDIASLPRALAAEPMLAARLTPTFARLGSIYTAHRAFPNRPGEWTLRRFSGLTARLAGDPPDLAGRTTGRPS
jgi:flavin-dependent dehydrogenase